MRTKTAIADSNALERIADADVRDQAASSADVPALPAARSSEAADAIVRYARRRGAVFRLGTDVEQALAVLVGVAAAAALLTAVFWPGVEGYDDVRVESNGSIALVVDVQTATWTDFAMIPGVGRTLAQRMVAARDAAGGDLSPHTIEEVRGIGPKTWLRIEPYLKFPKGNASRDDGSS